MMPLTLDDLLPLQDYVARRAEFFEALGRYLDRYRRVRIGPAATLLFENRQTLWFRIHEIIRIARLTDPEKLQSELEWYNQLLPGKNRLQAALVIQAESPDDPEPDHTIWQQFQGEMLTLEIGKSSLPATLVTDRPEDLCVGTAHWLQFDLDAHWRRLLEDFSLPAFFKIDMPEYRYQSDLLNEDVRQSLLDDLELSDKDAA